MFDMNNELLPLFRPQLNVFPRRHYSTGPSYEAALASIRVWIPTNHDRGTSSVHYRAIIVNTVTDGEVCLEGQGTSAGSHLAVQGDGGTTIRTIARGNQLALGTFITRDNGHIAILLLAVTNIACRVPTPMHRHAAYCKVRVEEARVGVDSVEAVVDTPNVHLAVAAEHRSRVHRSTGCKAPDLAASQRVKSAEAPFSAGIVVLTPNVQHLAVAAERRGRGKIGVFKSPDLAAGRHVDSVEAVVARAPDVNHLVVAAEHRRC